jgi:hypothetical protein
LPGEHGAAASSLGAGLLAGVVRGVWLSPSVSGFRLVSAVSVPSAATSAPVSVPDGPMSPPSAPASGVGLGAIGGSGGLSSFGPWVAVLAALVASWAAQALRRHHPSVALWRPMAFVSLLERPG